METYLVGGAVRDQLLGLKSHDRDWLVLNETNESMKAKGYRSVGQDFEVFLDPKTKEEYALPRGNQQTVVEDLSLRDLTINAMAQNQQGHLIDPFNGQADLNQRLLRHVAGFSQDPIRILRLCRFVAQLADFNFKIAPETRQLVREMVQQGTLTQLTPERVWQEIKKAMACPRPRLFFEALRECNALKVILPEIEGLYGMPQPIAHHPEIDTGLHCMMVLDQICQRTPNPRVRFAALCHDLGKATTPFDVLPSHFGHELRSGDIVRDLCQRLKAPKSWHDFAYLVAKYHTDCHRLSEAKPKTMARKFAEMGLFRKPEQLDDFIMCCEADSKGRTGLENRDYPQAIWFKQYFLAAAAVPTKDLAELKPSEIPNVLHRRRINAIREQKLMVNQAK